MDPSRTILLLLIYCLVYRNNLVIAAILAQFSEAAFETFRLSTVTSVTYLQNIVGYVLCLISVNIATQYIQNHRGGKYFLYVKTDA